MRPVPTIAYSTLRLKAHQAGLEIVGVTAASLPAEARNALFKWLSSGHHGTMNYLEKNQELLCTPEALLPDLRSIAVFAIRYEEAQHPPRPSGYGRVARYAWGKDYHQLLPPKLELLVALIEAELNCKLSYRVATDSFPLLERTFAQLAGIGFQGKNTLVIRPGLGSYFFVAEILWNLEIEDFNPADSKVGSCGSCRRCLTSCPTNAIVEPFVLDSRKCISYLTIEKRGFLNQWEREALGEWVFGCDICQDVCPFNRNAQKRGEAPDEAELGRNAGVGPLLELGSVLAIRSAADFKRRFKDTALMRAKREGLVRNAAMVAGNTGAVELVEALIDCFSHDSSPVVRAHALGTLVTMSDGVALSKQRRRTLLNQGSRDSDCGVVQEALRLEEAWLNAL